MIHLFVEFPQVTRHNATPGEVIIAKLRTKISVERRFSYKMLSLFPVKANLIPLLKRWIVGGTQTAAATFHINDTN